MEEADGRPGPMSVAIFSAPGAGLPQMRILYCKRLTGCTGARLKRAWDRQALRNSSLDRKGLHSGGRSVIIRTSIASRQGPGAFDTSVPRGPRRAGRFSGHPTHSASPRAEGRPGRLDRRPLAPPRRTALNSKPPASREPAAWKINGKRSGPCGSGSQAPAVGGRRLVFARRVLFPRPDGVYC